MRTAMMLTALALAPLGACTASHESVLTGYLYQPAVELNRFPVEIIAIDGSSRLDNVYRIEPGVHSLTLASRQSLRHNRVARQQTVEFTVQPCTRYYLAAQHESPLLDRWTMMIDYAEPIAGCKYTGGKVAASSVIEG